MRCPLSYMMLRGVKGTNRPQCNSVPSLLQAVHTSLDWPSAWCPRWRRRCGTAEPRAKSHGCGRLPRM